jgi:hypothetical protein
VLIAKARALGELCTYAWAWVFGAGQQYAQKEVKAALYVFFDAGAMHCHGKFVWLRMVLPSM